MFFEFTNTIDTILQVRVPIINLYLKIAKIVCEKFFNNNSVKDSSLVFNK